jgi:hypothetical protein
MDEAITQNHSRLSLYSLKAAMARFPVSQALQLLPALRHPHPGVRAAAVEILCEMAKREPAGTQTLFQYKSVFDRELATLAFDVDPLVRAVAAELIAHLDFVDPSSFAGQELQDQTSYDQLELAV